MSTTKKTTTKAVPIPNTPPKTPKKETVAKSTAQLVSFSIKATIPVMTFGNIQPEVVVKAKTIEEAQAYALPIIEGLFEKYCEVPRDGSSKPSFMSKAAVTVKETVVPQRTATPAPAPSSAPTSTHAPVAPKVHTNAPVAPAPVSPAAQAARDEAESKDPFVDEEAPKVKSQAYEKAEKAIGSAMSLDALNMIEDQIQNSVKLAKEEKPALLVVLIKRRKDFK